MSTTIGNSKAAGATVAGQQVGIAKGVMRTGGVHLLVVVNEERSSLIQW